MLDAIDNFITGGSRGEASDALRQSAKQFENLDIPTLDQMKVKLQEAVNAGEMTPDEAETFFLEASAQENVSVDPRLQQAQMRALEQIQGVADGGLSVGDRGDLQRIASQEAAQEKGQRDAILQNAQARGMGGSGLELASQLAAQQGAAGRASERGFDVAKQAQSRALEAMLQSGQLGGDIRSQEFGEQSRLAEARDSISKFNTQNRQAVNVANTDARNQAQLRNVNNAQDVANRNQETANQQNLYNAGNVKDKFTMDYQKAGGTADAFANKAAAASKDADRKQQMFGTILSAGAQAYNTPAK